MPGPFGLPGGYPVPVAGTHMELNLPADLSEEKAIAWNEKIAVADGVKIHSSGYVESPEPAKHAFKQYLPYIAEGFHAHEIGKITDHAGTAGRLSRGRPNHIRQMLKTSNRRRKACPEHVDRYCLQQEDFDS